MSNVFVKHEFSLKRKPSSLKRAGVEGPSDLERGKRHVEEPEAKENATVDLRGSDWAPELTAVGHASVREQREGGACAEGEDDDRETERPRRHHKPGESAVVLVHLKRFQKGKQTQTTGHDFEKCNDLRKRGGGGKAIKRRN